MCNGSEALLTKSNRRLVPRCFELGKDWLIGSVSSSGGLATELLTLRDDVEKVCVLKRG